MDKLYKNEENIVKTEIANCKSDIEKIDKEKLVEKENAKIITEAKAGTETRNEKKTFFNNYRIIGQIFI